MAKELYLPKSAYTKSARRFGLLRSPLGKNDVQVPEEHVIPPASGGGGGARKGG